MAIRNVFGMSLVHTTSTAYPLNTPLRIAGTPLYNLTNSTVRGTSGAALNQDVNGNLVFMSSYQDATYALLKMACVGYPLSAFLTLTPTTRFIHQMRFQFNSAATLYKELVNLVQTDVASGALDTAKMLNILSITDIPAFAINTGYYLEWEVDLEKKVINRWVDGAALAPLAVPQWIYDNIAGGLPIWQTFGDMQPRQIQANQRPQYLIRDGYLIEDTKDDTPCNRLGPQAVRVLPVKTFTAAGWTNTSTSTFEVALNTRPGNSSSSYTAPLLTSDAAQTPAKVTFDTAALTGKTINGLSLQLIAAKKAGTESYLRATLNDGAADSQKQIYAPAASIVTDTTFSQLHMGVTNGAPSGGKWTKAKLDTSVLTLEPLSGPQ